ncbi:hypothetical protein DUI87_05007 [Hirundo rustica rustica]|uniref:Integrase catalytic domain-containing protein n=1 Tax=Hirundo rustica rustica TaxID=333673 RepID=A0A3M0LG95_HIRRU|nr:hypothetical protein DUI87_05007 [Hirundo rustica rustica]
MPIDQGKELVYQINEELFALFGMKQIVLSHPQTDDVNERMSKTIKTFLNKYCVDHPNDWDEHLSAIAYAFNLTNLEPDQNTPYFQMFNRNPHVVEPMNICVEEECGSFAKIFEATKKLSQALEEEKNSDCKVNDNRYILQSAVVFDHDYIGLSERSDHSSQPDSVAEEEINAYKRDVMPAVQIPPASCKDQESADDKQESDLREVHCIEPNTAKPEQWPSPCWTLQTKTEDT